MRVIGLISGTSFDAIEVAAADFVLMGDELHCTLLGNQSRPYPADLRERIAAALPPARTTVEEVCRLDTLIGQAFAEVAAAVAATICEGRADLICSHGQTVYHWTEGRQVHGTLQLGQPAWIAERTGLPVVGDLRARDIAAGGQGAPLVSLLDTLLLGGERSRPRAMLNLGGIANLTAVRPGLPPIAYDTGPGNALIDVAVTERSGSTERFDRDGRRAARGHVDRALLDRLLDEPYYWLEPPKTTGKELFHLGYLRARVGEDRVSDDDLVATVTELTVESVAREMERLGVAEIYASGGGTRNPTLMRRLGARLPDVHLLRSDELGVPEAAKEALAFGLIGFLTVNGLPGTVPSCTGARGAAVLGSITPGRRPLQLPAPVSGPPRRIVLTPLDVAGRAAP